MTPALAIVRVGGREDDLSYERGACGRAAAAGVAIRRYALPADVGQEEILSVIGEINARRDIHGCLCGDVRFEDAQRIAGAVTPVPGGVGSVTTAVLMRNVVRAALRSEGMDLS